MELAKVPQKL